MDRDYDVRYSTLTSQANADSDGAQADAQYTVLLADVDPTPGANADASFTGREAAPYADTPLVADVDADASVLAQQETVTLRISMWRDGAQSLQLGTPGLWLRLQDKATAIDVLQSDTGAGSLLLDTAHPTDVFGRVASYDRALLDSVTASEQAYVQVSIVPADESVAASELLVSVDPGKSAQESAAVADALGYAFSKLMSAESVSATHTVSYARTIRRAYVNAVSVSDDLLMPAYGKRDTASVTDLVASYALTKVLQDSTFVTDTLDATGAGSLSKQDTGTADDLILGWALDKLAQDQASATDTILSAVMAYARPLQDQAAATDSISALQIGKYLEDTATATDSYSDDWSGGLTDPEPSDSAAATDSGTANLQDYASDYFAQDYVGTNYSFP